MSASTNHDPAAVVASLQAIRIASEILGGRIGVAKVLGLTHHALMSWRNRQIPVPIEYVAVLVEACKDPRITPWTIRPDYADRWELLAKQLAPQAQKKLAA
jgi:DNA-binding transcriptional regulator YdaS (Cro superfamily)